MQITCACVHASVTFYAENRTRRSRDILMAAYCAVGSEVCLLIVLRSARLLNSRQRNTIARIVISPLRGKIIAICCAAFMSLFTICSQK